LHLAILPSTTIGPNTEVGKLGSSLQNIKETPTPLQIQIQKFVKVMAIIGIAVFLLVWGVYFWKTHNTTSLLKDSHSQCQFSRNTCCIYYFHGLRIMAIDEGGVIVKSEQ
jgi:hypothetical protein